MEVVKTLLDVFVHLDLYLESVVLAYGLWAYIILFFIVFCETGLVVTPFLPGDSLLFVAGALAGKGALNLSLLFVVLAAAAIFGDLVNYWVGRSIGKRWLSDRPGRLLKPAHIQKTQVFYEKHGSKTIVLARFVPIVRTFAPFLAGVGSMRYAAFALYNIFGGLAWVGIFIFGGYLFGNITWVQHNFTSVILGIIVISLLPSLVHAFRK